jgi:hypothetical protein
MRNWFVRYRSLTAASTPPPVRKKRFLRIPSLQDLLDTAPNSRSLGLYDMEEDIFNYLEMEITNWAGLDVLSLASLIGQESVLHVILSAAMVRFNLIDNLGVDMVTIRNFAEAITYWYDGSNPYHNAKHAADTIHGVAALIAMPAVLPHVTDLDIYALLVAASVHDVGHTGQTNVYHSNAGSDLSVWFSDKSCLERYHLAVAFAVMRNPTR